MSPLGVFSHPQDMSYSGTQMPSSPTPNIPPFSLYPQLYILIMMPHGLEYPFGSWGQLSWLCPFPAPPVPSLVGYYESTRSRKSLGSVQALLSITKTSLYYQHCFQHYPKHSPILITAERAHSTSAKISTAGLSHQPTVENLQVPGRYGPHHLRQNFSVWEVTEITQKSRPQHRVGFSEPRPRGGSG